VSDPFAHLKENRWREVAEIDDRLQRGEIDLVVGVFNEHQSERTTEELLRGFGFPPTGGAQRSHPEKQGVEYRILWLDA
jgi:hypothetical protein